MKHFRFAAATATTAALGTAVIVTAAALAGTHGRAAKTMPFTASFAGAAVVQAGGSTANIQATGTGTGTGAFAGKLKLAGKGLGKDSKPCPLFNGAGVITTADGSTAKFTITGFAKACPQATDDKKNAVTGTATFKGGTKKFAKAAATFTFTGIYDRGTGKYTVKFAGKITF